jgi:four helix bundle protein
MAYQSFEDLEVWQRGCRWTVAVFKAFSRCREFTLKDQIQRAALSVPCNVAEGAERGSTKDFAHFVNIAKGSAGEVRTQLYIARKLDLIDKKPFDNLLAEAKEISAMLGGLRSSLMKKVSNKPTRLRAKSASAPG